MKKTRKILAALLAGTVAASALPVTASAVYAPINLSVIQDDVLRGYLENGWPKYSWDLVNNTTFRDGDFDVNTTAPRDSVLDSAELDGFDELRFENPYGTRITSIDGMNAFQNVRDLAIYHSDITNLRISRANLPAGLSQVAFNENVLLTDVTLSDYSGYSDSDGYVFEAFFEANPNLETLTVTGCDVTGISSNFMGNPNPLRSVNIERNNFIDKSTGPATLELINPAAKVKYKLGSNTGNATVTCSGYDVYFDAGAFTGLKELYIENTSGYIDISDHIKLPSGFKGNRDNVLDITFTSYVGSKAENITLSEIEGFDISKASNWSDGTVADGVLTPEYIGAIIECDYTLDDGTVVTWRFRFDDLEVAASSEDSAPADSVWVNGKDIKNKTDKNLSKYYKTLFYEYAGRFSGGKWCIAVTKSDIDTVEDFLALFTDGKVNSSGKTAFADGKKCASAKIKDGVITVTAGKNEGKVNVWIYEVKKNKETKKNMVVNAGGIAPVKKTVNVLMAAGSPVLAASLSGGTASKGESKLDLTVGDSKVLYIGDKKAAISEYATFKVVNSADTAASVVRDGNKLTIKALSAGKAVITVTCEQSGKSAKITVNCKAASEQG